MECLWMVLAVICTVVGIIGSIVPLLPGPPVSYVSLWMLWLGNSSGLSSSTLWIMGVLMLLVTVIDYIAPIWLTKKGGGSAYSVKGATIGMIFGLFMGPWGLVLGPLLGALAGELLNRSSSDHALKVALMSFVAFLLTTGLKLAYAIAVVVLLLMNSEIIQGGI